MVGDIAVGVTLAVQWRRIHVREKLTERVEINQTSDGGVQQAHEKHGAVASAFPLLFETAATACVLSKRL